MSDAESENYDDTIIPNDDFFSNMINLDSQCIDLLAYGNNVQINTREFRQIYYLENDELHITIKTTRKIMLDSIVFTVFSRNLPLNFFSNLFADFRKLIINDKVFNGTVRRCIEYIQNNHIKNIYEEKNSLTGHKFSLKYSIENNSRIILKFPFDVNTRDISALYMDVIRYERSITKPMSLSTEIIIEIVKRLNIQEKNDDSIIDLKFVD